MISSSLPQGYDPLKDPTYMSPDMRCYFKEKLNQHLANIVNEEASTTSDLGNYPDREADYVGQGKVDEAKSQEMLDLEHEEYLKNEIEYALHRIEVGNYGYCEETEEPIGVKRLLAFPMARYTMKVQQGKEALSG